MRFGMMWAPFLLMACNVVCATAPGTSPSAPPQVPPADTSAWIEYRNDLYGFALRYPPNYVTVQPHGELRPPPTFRVWFKEAHLANSPIANIEPPPFAVDVYENALRESLDGWLESSAAIRRLARMTREAAEVGGEQAVRVTSQVLVAPNVYYYVARGSLVYRFTPLGTLADQMLMAVRFTR